MVLTKLAGELQKVFDTAVQFVCGSAHIKEIPGFSPHTLQRFRINAPEQNFVFFPLSFLMLLTVAEKAPFLISPPPQKKR
jgi:hypothetical protein